MKCQRTLFDLIIMKLCSADSTHLGWASHPPMCHCCYENVDLLTQRKAVSVAKIHLLRCYFKRCGWLIEWVPEATDVWTTVYLVNEQPGLVRNPPLKALRAPSLFHLASPTMTKWGSEEEKTVLLFESSLFGALGDTWGQFNSSSHPNVFWTVGGGKSDRSTEHVHANSLQKDSRCRNDPVNLLLWGNFAVFLS